MGNVADASLVRVEAKLGSSQQKLVKDMLLGEEKTMNEPEAYFCRILQCSSVSGSASLRLSHYILPMVLPLIHMAMHTTPFLCS
jgi:hypothetical protein